MAKRGTAEISAFEERLGYHFADAKLLEQALTHGSSSKAPASYERLEFLGDRVLGLIVADALFRQHGAEREGKLAARHSAIVKGDVCADIAEGLGLADILRVGAVEKKLGLHKTRSILGDVMESVIGAIYLEGGLEAARKVVLAHWAKILGSPETVRKDAKTFVQEWALARAKALPVYETVSREGPEHRPEFTVRLTVQKFGQAEGRGPTKQAAEMAAAQQFIIAAGLR